MLWLELLTIYLAIGAPFGVSRALQRGDARQVSGVLGAGLRAALGWPFTAARGIGQRLAARIDAAGGRGERLGPKEQARRATAVALTELSRALPLLTSAATSEQLWQQCSDALEKYAGLTSVVNELDPEAAPGPRALELFRADGCPEAALPRAGRCIQRRNATRLRAHQREARQEFFRALDEAQSVVNHALAAPTENASAAVYIEELWLGFIERARQLCAVLDDVEAAWEVTRRLAGERLRPAAPALAKIPPPQLEVKICPPETSIAYQKRPTAMTARLG